MKAVKGGLVRQHGMGRESLFREPIVKINLESTGAGDSFVISEGAF